MAQLNVNGRNYDVQVEGDTPLLWVIREQVGLTGTKYGCGVAQCGACSVHVNGELRRSCVTPVSTIRASDRIVTIEGLSRDSSHPVQRAWAELDVPQCGYCQSGQIMAAAALLRAKPKPTDADIDAAMTNRGAARLRLGPGRPTNRGKPFTVSLRNLPSPNHGFPSAACCPSGSGALSSVFGPAQPSA